MSVKVVFPEKSNTVDGFGLPVYLSECKRFRLMVVKLATGVVHYYAHRKRQGGWLGVPGLPFTSKIVARQACEESLKRPKSALS